MVTAVKEKTVARNDLDPALIVRAYRVMLLARATEDKLASLYRAGMIKGGVFLGKGQEALSTASSIFLSWDVTALKVVFYVVPRRWLDGFILWLAKH